MGFDVVALVALVALIGGYWVKELAVVASGFILQTLYAADRLTGGPVKDDDPADTDEEPQRNDEPRKAGGLPAGPCRACGLFHIGLSPVHVEALPGGSFNIPDGVPFVCPRCWVEANPNGATNTVPRSVSQMADAAARAVGSVATGRDNPPPENGQSPRPRLTNEQRTRIKEQTRQSDESRSIELDANVQDVKPIDTAPKQMDFLDPIPAPLHGGYPDAPKPNDEPQRQLTDEEILEAATAPDICCDKCGAQSSKRFWPQRKDGKENGKFWCQSCVDALGGPGDKTKKKRRD